MIIMEELFPGWQFSECKYGMHDCQTIWSNQTCQTLSQYVYTHQVNLIIIHQNVLYKQSEIYIYIIKMLKVFKMQVSEAWFFFKHQTFFFSQLHPTLTLNYLLPILLKPGSWLWHKYGTIIQGHKINFWMLYQSPRDAVTNTTNFKAIEMNSLTILEARSLTSRCWQRHASSKASREGRFLAWSSFWQPGVFLGLWQHNFNICLGPIFFCL